LLAALRAGVWFPDNLASTKGIFRKWVEAQSPLGRIGQSDDIAPTAVYLASSDSKYLTGETIRVTGGIL